jgi:hypothetical protein
MRSTIAMARQRDSAPRMVPTMMAVFCKLFPEVLPTLLGLDCILGTDVLGTFIGDTLTLADTAEGFSTWVVVLPSLKQNYSPAGTYSMTILPEVPHIFLKNRTSFKGLRLYPFW